ncbi:hypothetical protein GCM10010170_078790 [Dactylosporangium salmoneum]|uniref:Uncharacterized protein n=1 Tax=Dactylosporangium salmoneum TaxID=53361 RepID=A0ABN3HBU9_9ACTN
MTLPPQPNPLGYPGAASPIPSAPPPQPKSNTLLVLGVIGGVLALCLIGVCAAGVLAFTVFKDKSNSQAEGQSPASVATRDPYPTDTYAAPTVIPTTQAEKRRAGTQRSRTPTPSGKPRRGRAPRGNTRLHPPRAVTPARSVIAP